MDDDRVWKLLDELVWAIDHTKASIEQATEAAWIIENCRCEVARWHERRATQHLHDLQERMNQRVRAA